jgi:hypothetical protein
MKMIYLDNILNTPFYFSNDKIRTIKITPRTAAEIKTIAAATTKTIAVSTTLASITTTQIF